VPVGSIAKLRAKERRRGASRRRFLWRHTIEVYGSVLCWEDRLGSGGGNFAGTRVGMEDSVGVETVRQAVELSRPWSS